MSKLFVMANKTVQTSYIQEDPQPDECHENVPPDTTDAAGSSKLKVQVENETTTSSMQQFEESRIVSDSCTLSTPLLTRGKYEDKLNLSGFRCALTPVLKSLNICNEYQTPAPLKHGNSPHLAPPFSPMSFSTENCQKPAGNSGNLIFAKDAPVSLIEDECLPEITVLDLSYMQLTTNDSVVPESTPSTSNLYDEMKEIKEKSGENNHKPPELPDLVVTTVRADASRRIGVNKSDPAITGILETEITFLDDSSNSEPSLTGQMSDASMDIIQDIPPVDYLKHNRASSELSGQMVAEPGDSDRVANDNLSSTSVQTVMAVTESTIGTSLEGTRDITMGSVLENGESSSETSGQKIAKPQTSFEDKVGIQPANITRNESSFSNMSAQGAYLSTSGVTSSKSVTSEMLSEPTENSNSVESKHEEVQGSRDTKSTSEVSQQSPKSSALGNNIFVVLQPSSPSASSDFNTTVPISCLENKTLDLQTVNCPKAESEARAEAYSINTNATFVIYESNTSEQERSRCEKHCTFDKEETAAVGFNNTVECKNPQNNGTITLSEVSSSERHPNTLDKPRSPKVCNLTKDISFEPPKLEASTSSEPNAKTVDKCNTFESSPPLKSVSGNGGCEHKDLSQSGQLVTDGLSDASNILGVITENDKASAFNLDDTLDLRTDFLITSTPMTNCKKREVVSIPAAQEKLCEDDPNKAASNIVCDRKTFLSEAAAKFLRPPSKVASHLLKNKSGIPARFEKVTAGLPVKRPRAQIGPVRNAAASEEPAGTTGISNSYNLRSSTAASKLPSSGFQRPLQCSIPFPRAATGVRPSTRINASASSSTDKSSGLAAPSTVTNYSQGKKHPLPKGEVIPVLKRKKTDALTSSSNAESTASACDLSNKAKTQKQPTAGQKSSKTQTNDAAVPASAAESSTACDGSSRVGSLKPSKPSQSTLPASLPSHGCTRCRELTKELKLKSDEIKRLKEELLKRSKQDS